MADPVTEVVSKSLTVAVQQPTHDPMYTGLGWVLILMMLGAAIAAGIMRVSRMLKEGGAANAKDDASATLYSQLAEQVSANLARLEQTARENAELVSRVAKLEAHLLDYQDTKALVERLKLKLDAKDQEIQKQIEAATAERKQFINMLQTKDEKIDHLQAAVAELRERVLAGIPFTCPHSSLQGGAA